MNAAAPTPGDTWRVLVVTLAIQAMVSMAVLTVPAVAPAFAQRLNVSVSLLGIYVALVYLGAMLASLMSGQAVRRYGAIRVSQGGLVICTAGLLLSLVPAIWAVALGALLIGMGYGPITPASSHLLARSTPAHRAGLVFSIKQTGVPVGGMLAGAVAPPLTLHGGPEAALGVVAILCLVFTALGQPLRAGHDADRIPDSPLRLGGLLRPLRLVLGQSNLRRLAATSFVFSGVQLCLAGYLVTYLHTELGYSLVTAGIALSVAQVGGVLGRIIWGHIADRFLGATRTLIALSLIMAASAVATGLLADHTPLALVLALVACFGASATGWNGVYLAAVARLAPPGMAGTATGGSLSVTFFGVVIVPALFGLVSDVAGSFATGYVLVAIPIVLCAVLLARGAVEERKGEA
jgi:MFS family permease